MIDSIIISEKQIIFVGYDSGFHRLKGPAIIKMDYKQQEWYYNGLRTQTQSTG